MVVAGVRSRPGGPILWLTIRNGSLEQDGPFIVLALVVMAGWTSVGAMLASRNPANPIGWLMMAFGVGFAVSGLADEWATYAYVTDPGGLPLGGFFVWLANWFFLAVVATVPIMLLLYPTGRVLSRRWRPLLWAMIGLSALGAAGTILRPGPADLDNVIVANPTGVERLADLATVLLTIAGIGFVVVAIPLCVVAVIWRFRRSAGDERQQIRWLAYTTGVAGIAVAFVSGFGLGPNETSVLNEASFYVFFVALGIGVPAAIGVALLKYRLWDLDVVLKKTLVATVVVVLVSAVAIAALLILSGILVGPVSDQPVLTLAAGLVLGALSWPLLRVGRRIADRIV